MTRKDMVSLTELAEQYSDEFPEYIIQSRMRSYNTLEFLRQWGNDINAEFDDRACEELIHQGRTASLTKRRFVKDIFTQKFCVQEYSLKQGQRACVQ